MIVEVSEPHGTDPIARRLALQEFALAADRHQAELAKMGKHKLAMLRARVFERVKSLPASRDYMLYRDGLRDLAGVVLAVLETMSEEASAEVLRDLEAMHEQREMAETTGDSAQREGLFE